MSRRPTRTSSTRRATRELRRTSGLSFCSSAGCRSARATGVASQAGVWSVGFCALAVALVASGIWAVRRPGSTLRSTRVASGRAGLGLAVPLGGARVRSVERRARRHPVHDLQHRRDSALLDRAPGPLPADLRHRLFSACESLHSADPVSCSDSWLSWRPRSSAKARACSGARASVIHLCVLVAVGLLCHGRLAAASPASFPVDRVLSLDRAGRLPRRRLQRTRRTVDLRFDRRIPAGSRVGGFSSCRIGRGTRRHPAARLAQWASTRRLRLRSRSRSFVVIRLVPDDAVGHALARRRRHRSPLAPDAGAHRVATAIRVRSGRAPRRDLDVGPQPVVGAPPERTFYGVHRIIEMTGLGLPVVEPSGRTAPSLRSCTSSSTARPDTEASRLDPERRLIPTTHTSTLRPARRHRARDAGTRPDPGDRGHRSRRGNHRGLWRTRRAHRVFRDRSRRRAAWRETRISSPTSPTRTRRCRSSGRRPPANRRVCRRSLRI